MRKRGFTLIEMIVATTLLAVGVVAALAAFSSATRATAAAEQIHTAILLAREKMTEIELQPDTLTGGDQQGQFDDPYAVYRWQEHIETTEYQNLFKVTVTVQWGPQNAPKERAVVTYLQQPQTQQNQPTQGAPGGAGNAGGGTGNGG